MLQCSTVTSNNAQLRCNFVDLYYSMFGSKTPNCLAKNEIPLSLGLPKIPKISKTTEIKRSASPFENATINQPAVVNEPVEVEDRETEPVNRPVEEKEEPADAIVVKVLFI